MLYGDSMKRIKRVISKVRNKITGLWKLLTINDNSITELNYSISSLEKLKIHNHFYQEFYAAKIVGVLCDHVQVERIKKEYRPFIICVSIRKKVKRQNAILKM